MRFSKIYCPKLIETASNDFSDIPTHTLLEKVGVFDYDDGGFFSTLTFGRRIMYKLEKKLRDKSEDLELQEMVFPTIQRKDLWEKSGRWEKFKKEIIELGGNYSQQILTPTIDEYITKMIKGNLISYRQLPLIVYHMVNVFKSNTPSKGIIRSREIPIYGTFSFDIDRDSANITKNLLHNLFTEFFSELGLNILPIVKKDNSFTNYIFESEQGQDSYMVCENGHTSDPKEALLQNCEECGDILEKRKGIGIAMGMDLGDQFTSIFDVRTINSQGKKVNPLMMSYAIGLSRLVYVLASNGRDEVGINWPKGVAPFEVCVLPYFPDNQKQMELAVEIYHKLKENGKEVVLDDRPNFALRKRSIDLIGIPSQIIIKNENDRTAILCNRASGKEEYIKLENLLERI